MQCKESPHIPYTALKFNKLNSADTETNNDWLILILQIVLTNAAKVILHMKVCLILGIFKQPIAVVIINQGPSSQKFMSNAKIFGSIS